MPIRAYTNILFCGSKFVVHESITRTVKIGPLENFPLYSIRYFGSKTVSISYKQLIPKSRSPKRNKFFCRQLSTMPPGKKIFITMENTCAHTMYSYVLRVPMVGSAKAYNLLHEDCASEIEVPTLFICSSLYT